MSTTLLPKPTIRRRAGNVVPGLALCAAAVVVAVSLGQVIPGVSALLIAIALGIIATNVLRLPPRTAPGLTFAAKRLLRWGIVFLGLQLVLADIIALGAPMLVVIVCIVGGGICGTLLIGRLLRMRRSQVLLIACGFSICGAAAVAAVDGVAEAEEEEVVTAVALVVIFGTLMIPLIPLAGGLLGLAPELNGMWAGGSIHEIAQVVAAGGAIGGGALAVAVIVKLARILMLAPVMAVISLRRRAAGTGRADDAVGGGAKRPPVVPLFILGFLAMVLLGSSGLVPAPVLVAGHVVQTALLAAAMFALGTGVKIRSLMRVGAKPFVLAAASTVLVASIALGGILLVHPGA